MGQVMSDAVSLGTMATAAQALLAEDRDVWRERGLAFAASEDIYDLVEHAVSALEAGGGE